MIITHYQSFQYLENIERQVDQVFNETEVRGSANFQLPVIKILATEEEIIIKAILPTLDEKSLEMQVTDESIVLSGNLSSPQKDTKFRKVIALPQPIVRQSIESNYFNGIYTIKAQFPKLPTS